MSDKLIILSSTNPFPISTQFESILSTSRFYQEAGLVNGELLSLHLNKLQAKQYAGLIELEAFHKDIAQDV